MDLCDKGVSFTRCDCGGSLVHKDLAAKVFYLEIYGRGEKFKLEKEYIITDIGSTTTKAILIGPRRGEYRLLQNFVAPTTVEFPYEDVTVGVLQALEGLGKKASSVFVKDGKLLKESESNECGASTQRLYLSTSSAGGGLQVLVCGVMKKVTAESARRAALGAGAIIVDVIAVDDDRPSFLKIEDIRKARPDMVLIAGGFDGGNINFVLEVVDLLNAADLHPRFGGSYKIPVIYAGNKDGRELAADALKKAFDVKTTENLRPAMDLEVLEPARAMMHELFMSHVMAHAPGYRKLLDWVDAEVLPTPLAVGKILQELAKMKKTDILACDIGGATTDIFSVIDNEFYRSVSANIGMSYSSVNVVMEAGIENIARWLPFRAPLDLILDAIGQKLVYPTTIPATMWDLAIEQALAREALRIALDQHKEIAATLPRSPGAFERMFKSQLDLLVMEEKKVLDMDKLGVIIGSGGVLSKAPRRAQAALMMLDAFLPEGVTELYVDSIFMMPHLGVLLTVEPDIAMKVLMKDCLVHLGPCVAPKGAIRPGETCLRIEIRNSSGDSRISEFPGGIVAALPLLSSEESEPVKVKIVPAAGLDVGEGAGKTVEFLMEPAAVGIIIDTRGRPISFPEDPQRMADQNATWALGIGAYTKEEIDAMRQSFA